MTGVPLHLVQRGNNRTATFRDSEDFEVYRETMYEASRHFGCAIHAYVLMGNHVHLLVSPEDDRSPSRMMQAIGQWYVPYFNKRYGRTGTLWEGRYWSSIIQAERYLLTCSRYIELNPVRAGIAEHPTYYRWSSYRHNADGDSHALITSHAVYESLGLTPSERRAAYRALFEGPLEAAAVDEIRHASRVGSFLGDETFRERIERALERNVTVLAHGGDRRSSAWVSSALTP
jgi:putative transposase